MEEFNILIQIISDLQDYKHDLKLKSKTFTNPKYKLILESKIDNISRNIAYLEKFVKKGYNTLEWIKKNGRNKYLCKMWNWINLT